jgi:uncharacterized membrane protein
MGHVVNLLKSFGRFWYGFVIGDDWTGAAAVLVMVGGVYGLRRAAVPAWWFGPLVIVAAATLTVHRGLRRQATDSG